MEALSSGLRCIEDARAQGAAKKANTPAATQSGPLKEKAKEKEKKLWRLLTINQVYRDLRSKAGKKFMLFANAMALVG